ncbi:hypothetical protein GCM10025864_37160 [Luteimicrobium album]|uniref:Uncharacterized protein n=1 Tax=Luteimicrobium album TaxID=1054550 RepID=A0ABQ6I671_9MICO|nr:hypothetical protein GCM10025864_37160 [Luteimicrobium album]
MGSPTNAQPPGPGTTCASLHRATASTTDRRSGWAPSVAAAPSGVVTAPSGAYPAPSTSNVRSAVRTTRAVISFLVSVPVLSEQIVVTAPSVSTDGRRRVIALRRAICWTPSASVMVTSAGSPSGTAATANPIDADRSSSTEK